ncbi:MAG: hypothetical protein ACE5GZ_12565 [Gammaproteobacteria bacterium]
MTPSQEHAEPEAIQCLAQAVGLKLTDNEMTALSKPVLDLIAAVEAATCDWEMTAPEPVTPAPGSSVVPA